MLRLMWFRSDLRISDNPALLASMTAGPTIAVYCLTQSQWDQHDVAPAKRSLIVRQLFDLEKQLRALNVPLLVLDCDEFSAVPKRIVALAGEQDICSVYFNFEYEINERHLSRAVKNECRSAAIVCKGYHDQCIVKPGDITTADGGCYKVFSAFKRACFSRFNTLSRPLYNTPKPQSSLAFQSDLSLLRALDFAERWQGLWPAGEEFAHDRLREFIEHRAVDYAEHRDIPSLDGTSALSPYLAVGALSTRQCIELALLANGGELDGNRQGLATWINELLWREFYRHLLAAMPRLSCYRPFKPETDSLPWNRDGALFSHWAQGETGYPIVDAAMQQLLQTGWMHNRLRMVTAMFLTKHLFIDWRLGEQFFMRHLVDGDLASNNGGWQWSASTGVDAVPYFRIFNPTRQSQRFDPQGHFIRQYLPQLASLDNKSIHQPSAEQRKEIGYPTPIVDHREAVAQTKAWFKALASDAHIAAAG